MILKAAGVFAAMAVADYLWAKYAYAISRRRAHTASRYAVALLLASVLLTLALQESWAYLLPGAAGAYIGTYLAVRL